MWEDRPVRRRSLCILISLTGLALAGAGSAQAITPTITELSQGLTAFSDPSSITLGPDGNLWFDEYASPGRIGKITPQGAITEVATGNSTPNFSLNPQINGMVAGPDGQLWFTEGRNPGRIGRINPATGAVQELATGGVSPNFTLNSAPQEIALGPDGNLWFAEVGGTGALGRITYDGVVTEFTHRPDERQRPRRDHAHGGGRRQPVVYRDRQPEPDRPPHPEHGRHQRVLSRARVERRHPRPRAWPGRRRLVRPVRQPGAHRQDRA